jgi:quercetin 2,3-dioxygenase
MSNLFPSPEVAQAEPGSLPRNIVESFPARKAEVGALSVRRILPVRQRRMVGPWCFFDRFGPLSFAAGKAMDVAPHPHIGLQTVSWLLEGEVLHNDSLGSESLLHPGELHVMTAGVGIAHSEETPSEHSGKLDGIQLWVALPDAFRHSIPSFAHYTDIPVAEFPGGCAAVMMGEMAGVRSSARVFSHLIASELAIHSGERFVVPLDRRFEHGIVILEGEVEFERRSLASDALHYLGTDRDELSLFSRGPARMLLFGGSPFGETIVMWWNFVARTNEEIQQSRMDWELHRFREVNGYRGPREEAPPLDLRLK